MTLGDVKVGTTVVVTKIEGDSAYKRRIMDMGITKEVNFLSEKLHHLVIRLKLQFVDTSLLSERQMHSV